MKKQFELRSMIMTSLLIALCYIATLINVPFPFAKGGLMHLGNIVLFMGAIILGPLPGALIGSIGMGLFDLQFYPEWAIGTIITRFIMGYIVGVLAHKKSDIPSVLVSLLVGCVIMLLGYYFYEVILTGNWVAPFFSMIGDVVSSIVSVVIVLLLLPIFKRIRIKFDK